MVNRVLPRALTVAALVATTLILLPARAEAQAAPLDHFWCYTAAGQAPEARIQLRDQFDPAGAAPQDFIVRWPFRFCNPVTKTTADGTVTPISNVNNHLQLSFITGGGVLEPVRRVRVRNQFGRQGLYVFDPIAIGVPSAKNTQGPPEGLDHFKCYRAFGPRLRNRVVGLKDQFQEGTAVLARAVLFCNPTEKRHGDQVTPIRNPQAHLVCYQATPIALPDPLTILSRNQFGEDELLTTVANVLCVPSQKLSFGIF